MTDTSQPKPASDLSTRFVAGVVMAAFACLAAWFGSWPLRVLVAAAAAAMIVEWCAIHRAKRSWSVAIAILMAALLLVGIEYFYPDASPPLDDGSVLVIEAQDYIPALGFFGIAAALGLVLALVTRRAAVGWGLAYIAIPSFALLVLSWTFNGLVFWVMVVTWATDIFAYFAGRAIGGPKLAPKISPNKTWAGLAGGIIGAALCGWAIAWLFELGNPFTWIGGLMAVAAQAGDLYESSVKRRGGVKDSGTILPGHGGVLDRLDGLLAVSIVTFLLLPLDLWTP
jgi:phosphatidate cytidylyltransferase